ncbi:MAG: DUF4157 domain-containing protein [Anaerolineales bacterium]
MSDTTSQVKERQAEKQRKPAPPSLTSAKELAVPDLPFDPELLFKSGSLENQALQLQRLPPPLRAEATKHIQQVQGNRHVQRLVKAMRKGSEAPTTEGAAQHSTRTKPPAPSAPSPSPAAQPAVTRRSPAVQPKLTVSEPDDLYEVEAERTADVVMKMPAPATPPPPDDDEQPGAPAVQRAAQEAAPAVSPQVAQRVESLRGGGRPLPESERSFFESRMGADFSGVRVHTDATAGRTAQDLSARAFTRGNHIVFGAGEYQPGTPAGRHLMAHELTHVLQQGAATKLKRQPQEEESVIARASKPITIQRAPAAASAGGAGSQAADTCELFITGGASEMAEGYDGLGPQVGGDLVADAAAVALEAKPLPIEMEGEEAPPEKGVEKVTDTPGTPITDDVTTPEPAPLEAKPHQHAGGAPNNASAVNQLDEGGGGLLSFFKALFNKFKNAISGIRTRDPGVKTQIDEKPQLEATGEADPGRADRQATDGQAQVQARQAATAQEITDAPGEELVQPQALQEEAPVELQAAQPQALVTAATEDMRSYSAMDVPAEVRLGADAVLEPMLAASLSGPQQAVAQAAEQRDAEKAQAIAEAEEAVEAQQAQAEAAQQAEVEQQRNEIAEEKQRSLEESQALQAEFETDLQSEQEAVAAEVDQRIAEDQAAADAAILDGEAKAEQEKARAEAEAEKKKADAKRESENESWWDRATSAVKSAISAVSEAVDRVFTALRETVKGIIEAAKNAAIAVIEAGRKWVVDKLDTFRSWVKDKVDAYLSERFPALAQALNKFVDMVVDTAVEAVNQIAEDFKNTVTALADGLSSTLDNVLGVFQNVIQAQIAVIGALASGDFAEAARIIFETALKTLGLPVDQIMGMLNKAGEMVKQIFSDPIGFLGNLIAGVKQGLDNFVANILTHLKNGFIAWLTGSLGEVGITLPAKFDLMGIFQLAMQILGVSVDQLKGKVTALLGFDIFGIIDQVRDLWEIYQEGGMVALAAYGLEGLIGEDKAPFLFDLLEGVQAIIDGDWAKIWGLVKEYLGMLKEMVIDKIQEFLVEKVIKAGVAWIISLCNPAGAIVRAIKAIYDIIMFFVERGKQIVSLVQAVAESIVSIASGAVSIAATNVEQALARGIPVAIGFLSSLLGLGGISSKVKEVIAKVRETVDNALDAVFNSKPVQAVAKFIRGIVGKIQGGLTKVKERVAGGMGKIKDFFFPKKSFAIGAETHTFSLESGAGAGPVLYMASTPRPLIARINEAKSSGKLDAAAEAEIPTAEALIKEIETLGAQADEETDPVKQEALKSQINAKYDTLAVKARKILGVPELTGKAKIKYDQVMGDKHIPQPLRKNFEKEVFKQVLETGPSGDQMPVLIGVVTGGDYLAKGPDVPAKELKAKGGMTRVIPLRTVWNDNLAPAYKAEHRSFEAWLGVLAKDNSAFSPPKHLNKGSTIPGEYATAWWAPRGEQRGNTMAELIVELALKASTYEGGCVRATIGPDAAKMVGFKKPTALDGIFFDEWVPSPSSPWGITGGGSLEAIAPKITLSQTTELEFLPGDMSGAEDPVETGLAAIDAEESKYVEDGRIKKEDAEKVAVTVKGQHPVFESITIKDGGETWDYDYIVQRTQKEGNKKKWIHGNKILLSRRVICNHQVEVHVDERGPHVHLDRKTRHEEYINCKGKTSAMVMSELPRKLKKEGEIQRAVDKALDIWEQEMGANS